MPVSYKIDWLTVSVIMIPDTSENNQVSQASTIPISDILGEVKTEEIHAIPFYTHGTEYRYGKVFVNERKPEQKRLIVVSGDDWTNMALDGLAPNVVLGRLIAYPEANVTRIDFAIDIKDEPCRITRLLASWRAGIMKTTAESVQRVGRTGKNGKDMGQTVYIGSRSSERMVRVYDKGAQQAVEGQWTRIEIELKGNWAMATAKAMALEGVVETGKAAIRQFVITGVDWFDNAVARGRGNGYIVPNKRPITNHEKWLMEVAVPAVIKAIASDMSWVEQSVLGAILAKHRGDGTDV